MTQSNNQIETSKESFNAFIENNPNEIRTIISMNERLVDYGRSIVDEIWNEIKSKQTDSVGDESEDSTLDISNDIKLIKGRYKDKRKYRNKYRNEYGILFYLIRTKNNKFVVVEMNFDKHKLHWSIAIYQSDWIFNWIVDEFNVQGETKESLLADYEQLKKYAESIGILKDNDWYQLENREMNEEYKIISLCFILPTGDVGEDKKNIIEKIETITTALVKGKSQGEISSDVEALNYSKEKWDELCSDYQKANLLDRPKEIPTFLEIARVNYKETNISNVLEFFLNPENPHPFGNIFSRALYNLYKSTDKQKTNYKEDIKISDVRTEESTPSRKKIDIFVESDKFVIAIENKIYAGLYNPLSDYREHAEERAKSGEAEGQESKETILVVLSPYGQDTTSADGWKSITYKDLNREVIRLLSENNWSLYHKDKHYLYMNLFHDLFKTIENLTYDHDAREKFKKQFLIKQGYACRQAIHNLFSYRESILIKYVKSMIEKEALRTGRLWNWYNDEERNAEWGAGKSYAEARKRYFTTDYLVYDTEDHRIIDGNSTFSVDTFLDVESGNWLVRLFFRNPNNTDKNLSLLDKYVDDKKFLLLNYINKNYPPTHLTAEIKPQGSKEKTQELLTDILTDIIQKIQ